MRKYATAILTIFIFSAQVSLSFAQDGPASAKEIQDTWVGKELTGTTASGSKATMRMEPDGKASVSAGSTNDT